MDSCGLWKYNMKKMGEPRLSAKYLEDKFQEYNLMYFKNDWDIVQLNSTLWSYMVIGENIYVKKMQYVDLE